MSNRVSEVWRNQFQLSFDRKAPHAPCVSLGSPLLAYTIPIATYLTVFQFYFCSSVLIASLPTPMDPLRAEVRTNNVLQNWIANFMPLPMTCPS